MRKIHWFPIGKVEHLFVLFVRKISVSQNISVNSGVSVSTIDKLVVADKVYLTGDFSNVLCTGSNLCR